MATELSRLLRCTLYFRNGSKPECPRTLACQLSPAADIRRIGSGPLRANSRPEQVQQIEQALLDHLIGE
jgi:hypothetical protein